MSPGATEPRQRRPIEPGTTELERFRRIAPIIMTPSNRHAPRPRRLSRPGRLTTLAALLITALILGACGGGGGAAKKNDDGTTLVLAIGGEADDGFDPTLGWGRYGSPLFQSTLLIRDADLELQNDLATGFEVSDDGLVWTVDIRDDARFSDGEPVTAADVAYTFNRAAEAGGLTDVTVLDEAVATSDTTVEFHLERPQSTFVNRLVTLGIVPEHAHGDRYAANPIGSGPYRLVSWDRGQQLIVERNDDHHGPRPAFDRLVFLFSDEDASLAAARSGDAQVVGVPGTLATSEIAGMKLIEVPSIDNRGITFPYVPDDGDVGEDGAPIGNDVTADPAIRRAVNLTIDRQALVDGVLEGHGAPAYGPVDGLPWFEPDSAIDDADPDTARTLLDEAGWTTDGDGIRSKDGVPARFRLLYPAADSTRQGLALAAADMIRPIGIDVDAVGVSWDEIAERRHADAVLYGWGSHDPTELYNLYHSSLAGTESWNPGFYANPTVDEHLDAAMAATDQDRANEHWRAAQLDEDGEGIAPAADAPAAWLVNLDHTYYVDECLDVGRPQIEPHGHGWPFTAGISSWRWTC